MDELHTFSTLTWTWIVAFLLHFLAEWRSMLRRCFDLSPCTRCSPLEYGLSFYESVCWKLLDDEEYFSRSVRIFRTPPSGVESLVVLPINLDDLWPYTSNLRARVQNNNNNSGEDGQLRESLSHITLPRQRLVATSHHQRPSASFLVAEHVTQAVSKLGG